MDGLEAIMCLGIGVSLSKMWYFIDRSTVS